MPLFAVVEIGADSSVLLLVGGIFLATFLLVGFVAYWLFVRSRPGPQNTATWHIDVTSRLPVSEATFDRIVRTTAAAISKPVITPEKREALRGMDELRGTLVGVNKVLMTAIGLAGIGASIMLFRQADSANMIGLPAAIILLFSVGALAKGLFPNRPIEPLDPRLFDKIDVQVARRPLSVKLGGLEMTKAADMLQRGSSLEDAARSAVPGYDRLDEVERVALQAALKEALENGRPPVR